MITIKVYFSSNLLYYLTNSAFEIWSLKVTDNIIRDHIKLLPLYCENEWEDIGWIWETKADPLSISKELLKK
jgi:hypothetical protein